MNLFTNWRPAAARLGVELREPKEITLSDGSTTRPLLHVPGFGGPSGTLVFADYRDCRAEFLEANGYYCSIFPPDSSYWVGEATDDDLKEVLGDWGWHGDPSSKPAWL